ncbi:MAG TPA: hypothetical protein VNY05_17885 [Candidatus Acidoferrales bacterium]|jgi:hypothetical protein|nr:hypothetical protein [Candidatus Acidoferrales bacterium]
MRKLGTSSYDLRSPGRQKDCSALLAHVVKVCGQSVTARIRSKVSPNKTIRVLNAVFVTLAVEPDRIPSSALALKGTRLPGGSQKLIGKRLVCALVCGRDLTPLLHVLNKVPMPLSRFETLRQ